MGRGPLIRMPGTNALSIRYPNCARRPQSDVPGSAVAGLVDARSGIGTQRRRADSAHPRRLSKIGIPGEVVLCVIYNRAMTATAMPRNLSR